MADDFVSDALKRAAEFNEYWQPIYDKARDDLHFQSDDPYAQWDRKDADKRRKSGRPVLTIDQLAQFVNQISNDIRMNTPSIDITPAGGGSDVETAEIYQGLIRNIEYQSNADEAYDNAVNFSVKCGIGYIRVDHGYPHAMSFEQELFIERIVNPFAVLFDPASITADGSDAMHCYVLETISVDDFKKKYPDANPVSFSIDNNEDGEITLAEYFYIEEQKATIVFDGQQTRLLRDDEKGAPFAQMRETTVRIVRRCKMNGEEKLEETTFPGEYIPIVPVYGEEAWQDGKRHLLSVIRRSKDAQRMFNYWASMETELLMRSPKAAWLAAEGTTEDYAQDYLNPDKAAVLRYKQKDSSNTPAPPPKEVMPPPIPAGIVNARQQSTQDIRATMGLYDSYLGQMDNAVSGVAIKARQGEGNRAVFHYADNLVRSITQVGRVLVSAIPEVYDTPRIVNIIGKEETNDKVGINGMYVEGQDRNYSLAQGQYAVRVSTGASYSTMRQEASEAYMAIVNANPQLLQVIGDLVFKYADFPGAQAISERFKRTIDPAILDEETDPAVAAVQMQNEQLQQGIQLLEGQIGQLQQQLSDKQAEIQIKMQAEQADAVNDMRKHEIELEKLRLEESAKRAEIQLKQQELELKAYELGLKTDKQASEQRDRALQQVAEIAADITERESYGE